MPITADPTSTSQTLEDADDGELLQLYVNEGNEHAFSILYTRWTPRLTGYALKKVGDQHTADDLVSTTWRKVFEHGHRFLPDKAFSTWIYTILTNLIRNEYRRRDRDQEVDFSTIAKHKKRDGYTDRPLQWTDPAQDVALEYDQKVRRVRVVKAVRKLSDHHLIVFSGREFASFGTRPGGGMRYEELSAATGVSIGTVKSRVFRARERWEKHYHEMQEAGEVPDVSFEPDRRWGPSELRSVLQHRGWQLRDGLWHMKSRRSPQVFSDAFLAEHTHFVARWWQPSEDELSANDTVWT